MWGRFYWIFIFVVSFHTLSMAQEEAKISVWKTGIELGTGLSFTGYNANLAFVLQHQDHSFWLGPKLVLSDTYLLSKGPLGLHTGYRYILSQNNRLQSFVSGEYQVIFFEPFAPDIKGKNTTHELHFSYGLRIPLVGGLSVGNSLGFGGYWERLIDPFDQKTNVFEGLSTQIRIFVQYDFN